MFSLFRSRSNAALDAFARTLADELARRVSPEAVRETGARKQQLKLEKALQRVWRQCADFQREHRPGVYGKARVGNTFQWELKERGYDEAFIDEVTRGVVMRLSRQ